MKADREQLATERSNPKSEGLDQMTVAQAFDVFDAEDMLVSEAVYAARDDIVKAIELVIERLSVGGRLIYVGAGTSGRLATLDAVECPPTFQSDPEQIQGRIAGGPDALVRSIEGAEDSEELGRAAVADIGVDDVVFGIAAGGTTPFVHAALAAAKEKQAATIFLACVSRENVDDAADVSIRIPTGPEVLAGSTRLKAGTATKMVLNRVTTIAMSQLGKVYGNRMVDVNTRSNKKLAARGARILSELTGLDRGAATKLLEGAEGSVKVAAVMHHRDLDAGAARKCLSACGGFLRAALGK